MCVKNLGKLLFIVPLFFVSCVFYVDGTVGAGNIISENIEVANFSAIENMSSAQVEILKGDSFKVELSDYENLLDYWDVKVVNNRLIIQTKPASSLVNTKAKVVIVMPDQLQKIIVSGSGDLQIRSAFENFETAIVNGSGSINSSTSTSYNLLDLVISGSGNIRLNGVADELYTAINGSGKIYLSNVTAQHADCIVSGSGDTYVTVQNSLKAIIAGSGNIIYSGSPSIDISDNGSGRLIKQ